MSAPVVASLDELLFDAWRRGDARAGTRLVARHDDAVRRYLKRTVGPDSDDAVQNVWAAISRCRDNFERRCSFRTFLFAVARNKAYEARRRNQRQRRYGPLDNDVAADPAPSAATVIEQMDDARQLAQALADLPAEMQRLVALYYFERRTAVEIGEMFGIPENTARSRIRRAKHLLRQQLSKAALGAGSADETLALSQWLERICSEES